jgi:uncharacterized protein YcbK (DUF882 family)
VPLIAARRSRLLNSAARFSARIGAAGFLLLAASISLQNASAEGDTRTLTFHHLHTGENLTITYMRDGRYDEAALHKLDWFMRDWRKEQSTHMDPHLYDILWEAYRDLGATQPIEVVCGYRSPGTNAMLRARSKSSGVAEFSQHTLGHAMDFYIPGVNLEKLREIGMRLQAGGVGFYPTSGSPFVHMDTGSIRHWPRMTYAQLTRVFPDGKTVHVAADGRPLPHFAEALAEVERRGKAPNAIALAQARAHGAISEQQVLVAEAAAARGPAQPSFFARLFGAKTAEQQDATASVSTAQAGVQVASATQEIPAKAQRAAASSTRAKPVAGAAAGASVPANLMALAAPDALSGRGALVAKLLPFEVASGANAFAYAPEEVAPVRGKPWQTAPVATEPAPQTIVVANAEPAPQTTIVAKAESFDSMISGAQRMDSPWLRAAMLTSSVSAELTVTQFGGTDPRTFGALFSKPAEALAMSFSDEPALSTDRFTGSAVVFLATATFMRAQTASLAPPNTQ